MIVRIDNRLLEILREKGVEVSMDTFRQAYAQRQEERAKDPKLARRRRMEQMVNDMMSGGFDGKRD